MQKPVTKVREGHMDTSGNRVYNFIRDLIVEGNDARLVNNKGRYAVNWSSSPMRYHTDFKSRSDDISSRKASNNLRSALLNSYEKEGAKEYKECQKRNGRGEITERQFQMPPRIFKSLFSESDLLLSDSEDGSEQETASGAFKNSLETPTSDDIGFEEEMDTSSDDLSSTNDLSIGIFTGDIPTQLSDDSLLDNTKSDDCPVPSDIDSPFEVFGIPKEELNKSFDKICSYYDQEGVVQGIFPLAGSVKGGLPFVITLRPLETLGEDDSSRKYVAEFDGISGVDLVKENSPKNSSLYGITPPAQKPGPVDVMVKTPAGQLLGITSFVYVDHETQEVLTQLVHNPALQTLFFTLWCQRNNIEQNQGPFTMLDQGSSNQTKHTQGLKVLHLLLLTAAQTNAWQFIQMIFSTSSRKIIFNSYKDQNPLPEDVARANGHDDLAQYLQDVNTRLSKEIDSDAQPSTIDWLELVEAVDKVQKQCSATEDETDLDGSQSNDDNNQSDYFADVETSSCCSFELDVGWTDAEDGKGPCSKDEELKKELGETSSSSLEGASVEVPCEVGTHLGDNAEKKDDKNWRKGDATTFRQQGVRVDVTQEKQSFTQGIFQRLIKGGTQESEDTATTKQEAKAYPRNKQRRHGDTVLLLIAITLVAVLAWFMMEGGI